MKKLVTLLLAAGMVMSAGTASAVELKVYGNMDLTFERSHHVRDFVSMSQYHEGKLRTFIGHANKFNAKERMRVGLNLIVSEQLSATLELQVGGGGNNGVWGAGSHSVTNVTLDQWGLSNTPNVTARFAFLDWVVPNTQVKVRMGFAAGYLPSATGMNPVLASDGIGQIAITAPINDWVSVTAAWLRPAANNAFGTLAVSNIQEKGAGNTVDLFQITVPMKFDGVNVTPWAVVGSVGGNVDRIGTPYGVNQGGFDFRPSAAAIRYAGNPALTARDGFAWWLGGALSVTKFDPFSFALDAFYSSLQNKHAQNRRAGWFVGASASYKTQYGVPTLKVWYASGDDKKIKNGSERPIAIGPWFTPGASTMFGGRYGVASTLAVASPAGTWGISAQWNNASFMENLFHSLRVTYVRGTNSQRMLADITNGSTGITRVFPTGYLSTADSAVEIDFDTTYNIYKNLAAMLEIGYVVQNFNSRLRTPVGDPSFKYTNAWRVALNFKYTF